MSRLKLMHTLMHTIIGKNQLWFVVDLKDAFSQISLAEGTASCTAPSTPMGVLRPRCMPRGLKNSPAVWRRVIKWVLADVWDVCDPSINDIINGAQRNEGGGGAYWLNRQEYCQLP